jgi:hypothetical protein
MLLETQAVAIEQPVVMLVGQQFAHDPDEMNACSRFGMVPPQYRVHAVEEREIRLASLGLQPPVDRPRTASSQMRWHRRPLP